MLRGAFARALRQEIAQDMWVCLNWDRFWDLFWRAEWQAIAWNGEKFYAVEALEYRP